MIHFPEPPQDIIIIILSSFTLFTTIVQVNQFFQLGVLAVTFCYTSTRFLNEFYKFKNRNKDE